MRVQYQIMELDNEHLKKSDSYTKGIRDRVCFIPAHFDGNWVSNIQDTLEEAFKTIDMYGRDYTEYTIIPRIYKNNL